MDRRTLLQATFAGLLGARLAPLIGPAAAQDAPAPFTFDAVVARAREMAGLPYRRPLMKLSEPFNNLKYDQFRAIRFHDEKRIFADGRPFQLDLMPPGFTFQDKIEINLVTGGVAQPVAFSTDFFDFQPEFFPYPDGRAPSGLAEDLGFSGIRIRHPINRPGVWDEFAVFQGASYFRAVAHGTIYGLSARGLAIGTGSPDPEEFPIFTAFWIQEPQPGDAVLRMSALLDSDSVSGAFDFSLEPGVETVMQVRAVLFPRRDIATVGIAPLTSMYFFGPDRRAGIDDFRNAVYDSEGLRMVNGPGERLWRPLRNPTKVETSAFADENPRAFGLIQRSRSFATFEDVESHYELRPSAWVEPGEGWGKGAVMLVELPSADESVDNIVVFWRPEAPLGRRLAEYLRLPPDLGPRPGGGAAARPHRRHPQRPLDARRPRAGVHRRFRPRHDRVPERRAPPRRQRRRGQEPLDLAPAQRQHRPGLLPLHRRRPALRRVPPLARQRRHPRLRDSGSTAGACDKPQPGRSGSDRPGPCARG